MTWEHRGELRADPGIAPGNRNIDPPKRRRSIWPSIAVVAAFAAFGGVIWFAYQNGRNANGAGGPPLVKADTTPLKQKPLDPGGKEIPFQDSTVYDRLNQGSQKAVVEKLLPPTEAPVSRPQTATSAEPPIDPPLADTPQAPPALPAPVSAAQPPGVRAPALGTPGSPLPDAASPTALAPLPGAIIAQTPPAAPRPAPQVKAGQPQAGKAGSAQQASSIAARIADAGNAAPAPKTAPPGAGAVHIQLSAVRSADAVAGEWARLKHRFPELAPLKSSSSKVDVPGKGIFYRVEAGPLDPAAAKSTCTRLRGQGLGCIVVQH